VPRMRCSRRSPPSLKTSDIVDEVGSTVVDKGEEDGEDGGGEDDEEDDDDWNGPDGGKS